MITLIVLLFLLILWSPKAFAKGGGGGGSGKVDFPQEMKEAWYAWIGHKGFLHNNRYPNVADIDTNMIEEFESAVSANAFTGKAAFDPTQSFVAAEGAVNPEMYPSDYYEVNSPIDVIYKSIAAAKSAIETVEALQWGTVFEEVADAIAEKFPLDESDQAIIDARAAFEAAQVASKTLAVEKFKANMATIGGIHGSAFVVGEALLNAQYADDADQFVASLVLQNYKDRIAMTLQGVQTFFTLESSKATNQLSLAHTTSETQRLIIIAMRELYESNLEIDMKEAKWVLDLFPYAGNLLAAPGGGVVIPKHTGANPMQSVLGGALSGAALGGAFNGGQGAAIGGMLGAAVGAIG